MTDKKIIRGSGGAPPTPPTPYRAPDTLNSRQFATILDLISEGEIEGFATPSKEEVVKVEDVDGYGKTFRESIQGKHVNDMDGDEPTTWKKIEECIPREDTDIDTDKIFLNYEDPDWSKDEYEWYKNEDGTDIKKEAHGSTNT